MDKAHLLQELNIELRGTRDLVEKITLVSDFIKEITKTDRCTIFVYDKDTDSFWSAHIDGIGYIEIPRGKGIVSRIFESKKCEIINSVKDDKAHFSAIDKRSGYFTKSMIAMPILNFEDRCLGVLQLLNKKDDTYFDKEDEEVISLLVAHVVDFIETGISKKD